MEICVEDSQPMVYPSVTKSSPVCTLLLVGMVSLTLVSILSTVGSILLAIMFSPRFLFATFGAILSAIGVDKCHHLYKALRLRENQELVQQGIPSSDGFSEAETLGFSISSNNAGCSESTLHVDELSLFSENCEEPISFFILDEGGLKIASIDFCRRERVDENLVAGFLSAIQVFSDEVFAQNIDQIKLDDYTLLVKIYSPFTFVYVFRGPVDPAREKLDQIIINLSEAPKEWSAIVDTRYTGKVLSDDTRYAVESMIRYNLGVI